MIELVNEIAEAYAAAHTTPDDILLQEVADYTLKNHAHPHMLSGHVQGNFLSIISKLLQPKRILEVGTFTGYSALCLAKGLSGDGELHTLELREEDAALAQEYFDRSSYGSKIKLHVGDAKSIIPTLNESWDIAFIDADKTGYIDYYELILPALKQNGLIIADNVLFHGQVLEQPVNGKSALAIEAFNKHVLSDPRVEQVLLTVRDGLLIIRKN